jgi:hypothetical protein
MWVRRDIEAEKRVIEIMTTTMKIVTDEMRDWSRSNIGPLQRELESKLDANPTYRQLSSVLRDLRGLVVALGVEDKLLKQIQREYESFGSVPPQLHDKMDTTLASIERLKEKYNIGSDEEAKDKLLELSFVVENMRRELGGRLVDEIAQNEKQEDDLYARASRAADEEETILTREILGLPSVVNIPDKVWERLVRQSIERVHRKIFG